MADALSRPAADTPALAAAVQASAANRAEAWNAAIEAVDAALVRLADRFWQESQRLQRAGHKTESLRWYTKQAGVKDALDEIRALAKDPPDAP